MKEDILKELAAFVRLAWDRQLTESTAGNMSVRIEDEVYITPTNFIKHFFMEDDFVVLNMDGEQIGGELKASSEFRMHLKIYKEREDIGSVFHAHPRWALVHAATHKKIPTKLFPETFMFLGDIEYIPYCMPGGEELADGFIPGLRAGKNVFVMGNHGVTTLGATIQEAYAALETLETCCFVSIMGGLSQGLKEIPGEEIKKLEELAKRMRQH